jgi:hypothetical protein
MARKAEATLWIKLKIDGRSVLKRMAKSGRSYAHKVQGRYESGSYYLRYTRNGKRWWESVGNDITLALQEQRARQSALEMQLASKSVEGPAHRILREVAGEFLATKPRENWRHIINQFGEWWGWGKDPADFQRSDFKAFGKYVASLGLRPRTEHNYLNQVCTF